MKNKKDMSYIPEEDRPKRKKRRVIKKVDKVKRNAYQRQRYADGKNNGA